MRKLKKALSWLVLYEIATGFLWLTVMCTSFRFELALEYFMLSHVITLVMIGLFFLFTWAHNNLFEVWK